MRAAFPEWYPLNSSDLRKTVIQGTIALDANVLLQLYRLGKDEREAVLTVLRDDEVRSRLWVPYQAAFEYQRNRLTVARGQGSAYGTVSKQVSTSKNALNSAIEQNIRDKKVREEMKQAIDAALNPVLDLVEKLQKEHVVDYDEVRSADPIREEIDQLFRDASQVGPRPTDSDIELRVTEAKARYANQTPPGYADAQGNNAKEDPEGDYLIWCEILDHAERSDRPTLFVTNDTKEDWYQLDGRNAIAPRTELKLEIATKTTHPYHQMTLEQFLRLANEHLGAQTSDDTLAKVRQLIAPAPNPDPAPLYPDGDIITTLRGAITMSDVLQADKHALARILKGIFDSSTVHPRMRREARRILHDLNSDWPSASEQRASRLDAARFLQTILTADDSEVRYDSPDESRRTRTDQFTTDHESRPVDIDLSWIDDHDITWRGNTEE
jgi:hypothetical protein